MTTGRSPSPATPIDHSGGLCFPDKLYGRDQAIHALQASFDAACLGAGKVVLVPGHSGVGKTALVQAITISVENSNGYFLRGKFNQYQQDVPYFAFRQAVAEFCRRLEHDDPRQRQHWGTELRKAVGNLGQLLVDLVPELGAFLGSQDPVADISPFEARHRFAGVFRDFLGVICRPEHPLVLVMDDWQWADTASLDLLARLQVDTTLRYLLVVVAYRDNEVGATHPLIAATEELRRQAVPIDVLEVRPLAPEHTRALLADALTPVVEDLDGLVALVSRHTEGNPFFIRTFINHLYELGMLRFEPTHQRWVWDLGGRDESELPDDVVDVFSRKLGRMEPASRRLLSLAACLGNRFDLETLAIVGKCAVNECRSLLETGLAQDLIVPADGALASGILMFRHDRVQQAAYTTIDPAALPAVRLEIGRLLWAHLDPQGLDEIIFQITDHMNAGYALIHDTGEQIRLVVLNVQAAQKARSATAYRTALQFQRAAARFLELPGFADQLWKGHHDLAMKLCMTWAEGEFLEGDRDKSEHCIRQAAANASNDLERADALNALIVNYTLLARYPEAIAAGREALAALGIHLPEDDLEAARDIEINLVRQELKHRRIAELADMPVMSDPRMRMAAKLLITLGPPCYRSNQRLWSVIVPKVVGLTLRYGHIPQIGYSHPAFGGLLGWVANDYSTAKEFGDLATRLMTSVFNAPSDQSVFYLMIGSSLRHWFGHLKLSSQDYALAYECGLRSGNLQYAAYAFGHNMYCRFYQGAPLAELMRETERSLEFSRTRINQWAIDLLSGGLRIFDSLTDTACDLDRYEAWEDDYLRQVDEHHNIQVRCIYQQLRAFALLIEGQFERALAWSDKVEPLIFTVGTQGLLPWPEHVFSRSLIISALYLNGTADQQVAWRVELEQAQAQFAVWSSSCADNFAHKHALLTAEIARLDGKALSAIRHYHQAGQAAAAGGFVHWEAVAHERAAMLFESCDQHQLAGAYWQHAYDCYSRWGATGKLRAMETARRSAFSAAIQGMAGPENADELVDQEFLSELEEKQLRQLRAESTRLEHASQLNSAGRMSRELAEAADRLRREMAERKQVEEQLQQYRESLEEAVRLRTLELEASRGQLAEARAAALNLMEDAIAARDVSEVGRQELVQEIAERKLVEEKLVTAKEEAETANVAKSRFLATMSHEIRTPLNGILGMAQMLLTPDLKDAERQDYARTVLNSGRTLLTLLNDILDLSKVEAGKFTLESAAFEPRQIIHETQALFEESASRKGLRIESAWAGAAGQRYLADPLRLRQMLSNLVANAIKFTEQGHVRIEGRQLEQDEKTAVLEFAVTDTGIGIPEEKQKLLFRAFSQADGSTTRLYGGTGLGLSIVRGLARLMSGDVGMASEAGHGARFWFRVRVGLAADHAESRQAGRPHQEKSALPLLSAQLSGHVLVVEDDPTNRKVVGALLGKLGLTVAFAENGLKGVEAVTCGDPIDLVLMDLQMPEMDGYEATEKIRQWEADTGRTRRPIIALTANAFEEYRQRCLAAGMDDFLSKPIASMDALITVLARWLSEKPADSSAVPATQAVEDHHRAAEIVREIVPLLAQNKFDAFGKLKQLQAVVAGTALAAEIDQVSRWLEEFRFDLALDGLRQIAATQGWERETS